MLGRKKNRVAHAVRVSEPAKEGCSEFVNSFPEGANFMAYVSQQKLKDAEVSAGISATGMVNLVMSLYLTGEKEALKNLLVALNVAFTKGAEFWNDRLDDNCSS